MKKYIIFSLMVLLVALYGCQADTPDTLTSSEEQQLREEITRRFDAWMEAANQVDMDRVGKFLSEDIQFGSNGRLYTDRQQMIDTFTKGFRRLDHQDIVSDSSYISLLSPNIAIQAVEGTFTATDTAGITSDPTKVVLTIVWEKQEGTWMARQGHQSFRESG